VTTTPSDDVDMELLVPALLVLFVLECVLVQEATARKQT
jgi:hypothetical protein